MYSLSVIPIKRNRARVKKQMEIFTLEITIDGQSIHKYFSLKDGKIPENIKEHIQGIVDTLLDKSEL